MRKLIPLLLVLGLWPSSVQAADRLVPGTYATVNAALAAAGSGDVIKIAVGTYTECIVLPNKGPLASRITIRSATADGNLPAAGTQINPTYSAFMPTITACAGGAPALKAALSAEDYNIGPGLHFTSNPGGYNTLMELGSNSTAQHLLSHQPGDITVDRVWIDGDPVVGQKVGIDLNGRNISVLQSYIDDIHTTPGSDSAAVRCIQGTGPYRISGNFLNSSTYHFICGGDDPNMRTFALVNSGATTTGATLNTLSNSHPISELKVGQRVAILTGGGTARYHPKVVGCGTTTIGADCSSLTITYEAIPAPPDTGAASDIRWGTIPADIDIDHNYFYRPISWMNPIIGQTGTVTPTASTASGTLPANTYFYRVIPLNDNGYQNANIYGTGSLEVSATLTAAGNIALDWADVTDATQYKVYRSTVSGTYTSGYFLVTTSAATDSGQILTSGGYSSPTVRNVKNMLELKEGIRVHIFANVFENSWTGTDIGSCLWIKSNNQSGSAEFTETTDVLIEQNTFKGCPGWMSVLGRKDTVGENWSRPIENLTVRNNVVWDSDDDWLQGKSTVYGVKMQSPANNVIFEHNTIINEMRGAIYFTKTPSSPLNGTFIYRNNLALKEQYGIFGASCTSGTECGVEANNVFTFLGNVLCDAKASDYPTGNLYPTCAVFKGSTHFEDYTSETLAGYALKVTSTWKGTATDGGDPGANIALVTAAINGVATGAPPSTTPPSITTSSPLTSVVEDVAMSSQCFAQTGGTGSIVWSIPTGYSLPTGVSLNSSTACLTGTPTTPGTYTFNVRAVDSTGLSDENTFQWTITPTSATLTITTTTLPTKELSQAISQQIVVTGGTPPYNVTVNTGSSLPSWLSLTPSGLLNGVASAVGTFNFTLLVTDGVGGTDTQALSQVVTAETQTCGRSSYVRIGGITIQRAFFRGPVEPSTSSPSCARKDDGWFDTTTNTRRIATQATPSDPIVWSIDTADSGLPPNAVVLNTDAPPELGSIPFGTIDGGWTVAQATEIRGLDAAAIATGTIDRARLPGGTNGTQTLTIRADATDFSMAATASFSEITSASLHRVWVDLTNYMEMKVHFMQTAAATTTPRIEVQYSLNNGSSWTSTGVSTNFGTVANTYAPGTWILIPSGAKTEVLLRVGTIGGNGSESPDVANIYISVR